MKLEKKEKKENYVIDAIENTYEHRREVNFVLGWGIRNTLQKSWHLIKVLKDGKEFTRQIRGEGPSR